METSLHFMAPASSPGAPGTVSTHSSGNRSRPSSVPPALRPSVLSFSTSQTSLTGSLAPLSHGLIECDVHAPLLRASRGASPTTAAAYYGADDHDDGPATHSAATRPLPDKSRDYPPSPLVEAEMVSRCSAGRATAIAAAHGPRLSPHPSENDKWCARSRHAMDVDAPSLSSFVALEAARRGPLSTTADALATTTTTLPQRHAPGQGETPRTHQYAASRRANTSSDSQGSRDGHTTRNQPRTTRGDEHAESVAHMPDMAQPVFLSHAVTSLSHGGARSPTPSSQLPTPEHTPISSSLPDSAQQESAGRRCTYMTSVARIVGAPRTGEDDGHDEAAGSYFSSAPSYGHSPALHNRRQPPRDPSDNNNNHHGQHVGYDFEGSYSASGEGTADVKRVRLERSSSNDGNGSFTHSALVHHDDVDTNESPNTAVTASQARRRGGVPQMASLLCHGDDELAANSTSWSMLSRGAHALTPLEDDNAHVTMTGGGLLFTHDPRHPFGLLGTRHTPTHRPMSANAPALRGDADDVDDVDKDSGGSGVPVPSAARADVTPSSGDTAHTEARTPSLCTTHGVRVPVLPSFSAHATRASVHSAVTASPPPPVSLVEVGLVPAPTSLSLLTPPAQSVVRQTSDLWSFSASPPCGVRMGVEGQGEPSPTTGVEGPVTTVVPATAALPSTLDVACQRTSPQRQQLRPRMQLHTQGLTGVPGSGRRCHEMRELHNDGPRSLSSSMLTGTPPRSPNSLCARGGVGVQSPQGQETNVGMPWVSGGARQAYHRPSSSGGHAMEHYHALPLLGVTSSQTPPHASNQGRGHFQDGKSALSAATAVAEAPERAAALTPPHSAFADVSRSLESFKEEEAAMSCSVLTAETSTTERSALTRTVPPSSATTSYKPRVARGDREGMTTPSRTPSPPPLLGATLFAGTANSVEQDVDPKPPQPQPQPQPGVPSGHMFTYSHSSATRCGAQAAVGPAWDAPHAVHYDPFAFVKSLHAMTAAVNSTSTSADRRAVGGQAPAGPSSPVTAAAIAGSSARGRMPVSESLTSLSSPAHNTFGLYRPPARAAGGAGFAFASPVSPHSPSQSSLVRRHSGGGGVGARTLSGTTCSTAGFLVSVTPENELYGAWSGSPLLYGQPSPMERPLCRRRSTRSTNSVASSIGAFFQLSRGTSTLVVQHKDGTRQVTAMPVAPHVNTNADPSARDRRRRFNDERELSWSFIVSATPTSSALSTYYSSSMELVSPTSAVLPSAHAHETHDHSLRAQLLSGEENEEASLSLPVPSQRGTAHASDLPPGVTNAEGRSLANTPAREAVATPQSTAEEHRRNGGTVVCDVLAKAPHRFHFYMTDPETGEKKPRYRRFLRRHRRTAAVTTTAASTTAHKTTSVMAPASHTSSLNHLPQRQGVFDTRTARADDDLVLQAAVSDGHSTSTDNSRQVAIGPAGSGHHNGGVNGVRSARGDHVSATPPSCLLSAHDIIAQSSQSHGTYSESLPGSVVPARALVMSHSRSASALPLGAGGSEPTSSVDVPAPLALSFSHSINLNGASAKTQASGVVGESEDVHGGEEVLTREAERTSDVHANKTKPVADFHLSTASLLFYDDVDDDALPIIDHRLRKFLGAPLWYEDATIVELDESAIHTAAAKDARARAVTAPLRFFQSRERRSCCREREVGEEGEGEAMRGGTLAANEETQDVNDVGKTHEAEQKGDANEEEEVASLRSLSLPEDALFFVADVRNAARDYRLDDYFIRCTRFVCGPARGPSQTAEQGGDAEDHPADANENENESTAHAATSVGPPQSMNTTVHAASGPDASVSSGLGAAGVGSGRAGVFHVASVPEASLGTWQANAERTPHSGRAHHEKDNDSSPLPRSQLPWAVETSAAVFSVSPNQLGAGLIFDELPSMSRLSVTADEVLSGSIAGAKLSATVGVSTHTASALAGGMNGPEMGACGSGPRHASPVEALLSARADRDDSDREDAHAHVHISEGSAPSPLQMALVRHARRAAASVPTMSASAAWHSGGGGGSGHGHVAHTRRASSRTSASCASPSTTSLPFASETAACTPACPRAVSPVTTMTPGPQSTVGDADAHTLSRHGKSAVATPKDTHASPSRLRHTHAIRHHPVGFVYPGDATRRTAAARALLSGLVCIDLGGKLTYVDPRTATGAVKLLVDAAVLQRQQQQQRRSEETVFATATAETHGEAHTSASPPPRAALRAVSSFPSFRVSQDSPGTPPRQQATTTTTTRAKWTGVGDGGGGGDHSCAEKTSPAPVTHGPVQRWEKKARRLSDTRSRSHQQSFTNERPGDDDEAQPDEDERLETAHVLHSRARTIDPAQQAQKHPITCRGRTHVGSGGRVSAVVGAREHTASAANKGHVSATVRTPPRTHSAAQLIDPSGSPVDVRRGFQPTLPFFQALQAHTSSSLSSPPPAQLPRCLWSQQPQRPGSALSSSLKSNTCSEPVKPSIPSASARAGSQESRQAGAVVHSSHPSSSHTETTQRAAKQIREGTPCGVLAKSGGEAALRSAVTTTTTAATSGAVPRTLSSAQRTRYCVGAQSKAHDLDKARNALPHSLAPSSSAPTLMAHTPSPTPKEALLPACTVSAPSMTATAAVAGGDGDDVMGTCSHAASSASPVTRTILLSADASSPYTENRPVARRLLVASSEEPTTPLPPELDDAAAEDSRSLDGSHLNGTLTEGATRTPARRSGADEDDVFHGDPKHNQSDAEQSSYASMEQPHTHHTPARAAHRPEGGARGECRGCEDGGGGSGRLRVQRTPSPHVSRHTSAPGATAHGDQNTSAAGSQRGVDGVHREMSDKDRCAAGTVCADGGVSSPVALTDGGGRGILVSRSSFRRQADTHADEEVVGETDAQRMPHARQMVHSASTGTNSRGDLTTLNAAKDAGEGCFVLSRTRSNVAEEAAARYTAAARSVGRSSTGSHATSTTGVAVDMTASMSILLGAAVSTTSSSEISD